MDDTHGLLGRLAVQKGWIKHAQLIEAVAEQGRFGNESKKIGEVLVAMGFLNDAQIGELLKLQRAFTQAPKKPAAEDDGWRPGQDPFAAATAARKPAPKPEPKPAPPADHAGGIELDWRPPSAEGPGEPAAAEPFSVPAASASPAPPTPPAGDPFAAFETPAFFETPAAKPAAKPAAPRPSVATPPAQFAQQAPQPPSPPPPAVQPPPTQPPPEPARVTSDAPKPKLRDAPLRSKHLDDILGAAARKGASDVHLHPGAPLSLRIHGELLPEGGLLDNAQVRPILDDALTPGQRAILDEEGQLDLAYAVEGIGRFRGNIYDGHSGRGAVFRFIPGFVPTLSQLGLPSDLSRVTTFHQGMVLVTGPAGSGKSTTLAALVDLINEERDDHILTVEDPVEYLHPSKRCLVNQREVHRHTTSFGRALRAALREDPDILVIGELRDLETISLAMTAAETGHLVLATLHTSNSIRTINRLVGAFPPDEQGQIRTMLSESLRAVISQRLVKRKDRRGRVAALEILRVDVAVANTIRENRTFQLRSTLQTGQSKGMLLLDNHLAQLVQQGVIEREEALRHAEDPRLIGGA